MRTVRYYVLEVTCEDPDGPLQRVENVRVLVSGRDLLADESDSRYVLDLEIAASGILRAERRARKTADCGPSAS